jgi:NAD(P)H dehydrogenase (quinone)
MSVVVMGATGHLGHHAVEALLDRGVEPDAITAVGRSVQRLDDLAEQGVKTAQADYRDAASLDVALRGAHKLLLVSGTEPDRVNQHQTVIAAAKRAGVKHVVYTSAPKADKTTMLLAADHRATEQALASSGLATTLLRNAWYVENYTSQLPAYIELGMIGAADGGRVSVALRREYAEAAAVVLTVPGHEGRAYELGGPAVTMPDIAAAISAASGTKIEYADVPVDVLWEALVAAGLPEPGATVVADIDRAIADGELVTDPATLEGLLGRPVTPLGDAVKEALASQ